MRFARRGANIFSRIVSGSAQTAVVFGPVSCSISRVARSASLISTSESAARIGTPLLRAAA
jgi:hypothetical protein